MFQRLSSLFFGEVEEASKELKTPKPSVLEADEEGWLLISMPEGATMTESTPIDEVFVELPVTSVHSSHGDQFVIEDGMASLVSLTNSVRASEPMPSVVPRRNNTPGRVTRGAASQVGPLAKVTQVGRVQRAQARADRRHLSRSRIQRQNIARERVPRRAGHARNTFLHQPCLRSFNH
ncbi:hypothetical protein MATL_G00074800 [Megalops atlanticus]|uniref:Tumor protein p53-inducible nuclear protein 2 n=1 Tax=Megalops atlanticus TaxID=7932 RepID=A0A9D3Q9J1_MEGAT|nr:hypothetical protein MATL_G00074800 [Megalops atlanticus]